MKKFILIFLIIIFSIFAHDLEHQIKQEGNCVVVEFYFSDNTKFSYEEYQVYRENEDTPFQIGRTDTLGKVVFCPDKKGVWKLKVVSEDGHGAIINIHVQDVQQTTSISSLTRVNQILLGILLILGIFGVIKYFYYRR